MNAFTKNRPVEVKTQAADPADHCFKAMRPYQLIDFLEEEQEQAEIMHLRSQIRTHGRIGMMEAY